MSSSVKSARRSARLKQVARQSGTPKSQRKSPRKTAKKHLGKKQPRLAFVPDVGVLGKQATEEKEKSPTTPSRVLQNVSVPPASEQLKEHAKVFKSSMNSLVEKLGNWYTHHLTVPNKAKITKALMDALAKVDREKLDMLANLFDVPHDETVSDIDLRLKLLSSFQHAIHAPAVRAWNTTFRWGLIMAIMLLILYSISGVTAVELDESKMGWFEWIGYKFSDAQARMLQRVSVLLKVFASLFGLSLATKFLLAFRKSWRVRRQLQETLEEWSNAGVKLTPNTQTAAPSSLPLLDESSSSSSSSSSSLSSSSPARSPGNSFGAPKYKKKKNKKKRAKHHAAKSAHRESSEQLRALEDVVEQMKQKYDL